MLIFDKEKVLASIKEAGNEDKINDAIIEYLNNYDGQPAVKSDWDALIHDKELYIVRGRNGSSTKVEKRFLSERGE